MRRIVFFEDSAAAQLRPISLLRPVFELLCGHFSVRERVLRGMGATEWGALMRPHLVETFRQQHPEARVNDEAWLREAPALLVNGRWLCDPHALLRFGNSDTAILDGTVVALTLDPDEAPLLTPDGPDDALARIAAGRRRVPAGGRLVNHPWDLIDANAQQLTEDFRRRTRTSGSREPGGQIAVQGAAEDVYVDPSAEIDPFVVLDARHGPIWVDAGAKLQPFTRVEGPAYIGRKSQLFRANVREGTSIGPVCRVGGEIEGSILHSYVNKYHDGFLGHSYVCPWVNLGALTTNSDLKNDYSHVRVPLWGEPIATGSTKVGCFIGDHTKTALGSLINTGSSIGVMCMVLPDGELLPKHIPSFTRMWHGRLEERPDAVAGAIEAARTAMARREVGLTSADERLLHRLFEATRAERQVAVARDRQAQAVTV
jgi:UDP-N-acetylglucosamine diphosphorylase/glucosamine-1-phosphate N-acetyltransferase